MSECYPTEDEDGVTVCAAHRWFMAGIAPGDLCIEGRLIRAEATIKRVRYVVNTGSFARPDPSDWESGYNQALKDVWMEMEEGE